MGNPIKLVGEYTDGVYLFAYEKPNKDGLKLGFVYINNEDGERRFRDQLLGSIIAHNPYLEDTTTVFSPEELERIVKLPPS